MADPLDVLRTPLTPVDPDPTFAARLRARVERALDLPRGVSVSTTIAPPRTDVPSATGAAIPYLAVNDARRAIDWYVEVFDARLADNPIIMPDGRVGHAELALAGGTLYLADEYPEIGHTAPTSGAAAVSLVLRVPDADATVAAAAANGGQVSGEVSESYGHRGATVLDPFGHRWMVQTPLPATPGLRQGDTGYVSLWVPDAERAAAFYTSVLGWTYGPVRDGRSRQVEGQSLHIGIWGGVEPGTMFCCYAVADADAAVERVRAAGGQAEEPTDEPYGRTAMCADDQGVAFAVYQPPAGSERPTGDRHGDLGYVTMEAEDSALARAFYGSVLGWSFTPGRVADGWGVQETVPMTGMAGGHGHGGGVPMWMVEDVPAAVGRVRAAGGTATDPERQPYGLSADCTDDQGVRFYLGESGH